jgi:hypothetical protein
MFFFIIFLFVLNFLIVVKNRAPEALPLLNPQEAPPQEARHLDDDLPMPLLDNVEEAPPQEARHHEDDEPMPLLDKVEDDEPMPLLDHEAPPQDAHQEYDEPPKELTRISDSQIAGPLLKKYNDRLFFFKHIISFEF